MMEPTPLKGRLGASPAALASALSRSAKQVLAEGITGELLVGVIIDADGDLHPFKLGPFTREKREADEVDAKPWSCSHCGKRYKAERWAVKHEQTCTRQPRDAEHRWNGYRWLPDGRHEDTCRCGQAFVAGTYGGNAAALRAHFNEHEPDPESQVSLFARRSVQEG